MEHVKMSSATGHLDRDSDGLASTRFSNDVEERIRLLTDITLALDLSSTDAASVLGALTNLSSARLSAKRSINTLDGVEHELLDHLAAARHVEWLLNRCKETFEAELAAEDNTATLKRKREVLIKKAQEQSKRLDAQIAAFPERSHWTVSDLIAQRESIRQREHNLKAKLAKLKAFHGLPPNIELARNDLQNARDEQMKLLRLRDRLLGRMAESVT